MIEYKSPFSITNEIVLYVSSISEKIGNITAINNIDSRPHLRKNNRIQSIYSSLKIEANSLSLGEVRDVINGRTVIGTRKEIQEVKNAYDAYEQIDKAENLIMVDISPIINGPHSAYMHYKGLVNRQITWQNFVERF